MIEGNFVPMSDEEEELMQDLFVLTREAHNDGVSKVRIAGILAFFAAGAIDPKSLDADAEQGDYDPEHLRDRLEREQRNLPVLCPLCEEDGDETEIRNVRTQLGGQLMVQPCGHVVEWDEREKLGDWVDQYDPYEEDEEINFPEA